MVMLSYFWVWECISCFHFCCENTQPKQLSKKGEEAMASRARWPVCAPAIRKRWCVWRSACFLLPSVLALSPGYGVCAHAYAHTPLTYTSAYICTCAFRTNTHFQEGSSLLHSAYSGLRDDYKSRQVTQRLTIKREFLFCGSGYWIQGPTELLVLACVLFGDRQ